jgi:hypothetical protein
MTVSDTADMVRQMNPDLRPGRFVFCSPAKGVDLSPLMEQAIATFREEEGLSLLLPEEIAAAHGLTASAPMCQITLQVYSDLAGIGLTAAVSAALTDKAIPCNIIAATLHDHVFVPADKAQIALAALRDLQRRS